MTEQNNLPHSSLPPVRRIVTGHDSTGKSVIKIDDTESPTIIPNGDARNLLLWSTPSVPASNNDERDGRDLEKLITIDKGSVIRVIDLLPGKESPMHRTHSIDYGIVVSGEVEMELEDGSKTSAGAGDVIIQRGTNHLWRNVTNKPVRIIFVLIEAIPYLHNGVPLEEDKA